eukprot:TRINITY_DN12266_c0_g1_i1.p1 TRINITY_DN12266_c0_g1~~TRINITY_DN12266_c0_g1_i1.p1  ORF type:complete len:373 (-),score=5.42 TRINITY_DN12266_c0_g1_i1:37-1155(-)
MWTCNSKFEGDKIALWFYVGSTILCTLTTLARCGAARFSGLSFTRFQMSIFGMLIIISLIRVHHVSAGCVGDVIPMPTRASPAEFAKNAMRNAYVNLPFLLLNTIFLLFIQDSFKVIHTVYITFHDSRSATDVVPRQHTFWCIVCGRARNIWKLVNGFVVIAWYISFLFALGTRIMPYNGPFLDIVFLPMLVISAFSVFRIWNSIKNLRVAASCHSAPRRGEDGCSVHIDDDTAPVADGDSLPNVSVLHDRWSSLTWRSSVADGEFPRSLVQPVIQGLKRALLLSVTCSLVFAWRFFVVSSLQIFSKNILSSTDPLYVFFILPHLFLCEIFPVGVISVLYLVPAISALRDSPVRPNPRFRGEEFRTTSVQLC